MDGRPQVLMRLLLHNAIVACLLIGPGCALMYDFDDYAATGDSAVGGAAGDASAEPTAGQAGSAGAAGAAGAGGADSSMGGASGDTGAEAAADSDSSGGGGGDAGADGDTEGAAGTTGCDPSCEPSLEECNGTLCVAAPVLITYANPQYAIDKTEVTQRQYDRWIKTNPSPPAVWPLSACNGYASFAPSFSTGQHDPQMYPFLPVTGVSWCDAYAYCAAVGKSLCGTIADSGNVGLNAYEDLAVSRWYNACTHGNPMVEYPGGSVDNCNGPAQPYVHGVDQDPSCNNGDGVWDLSGNVAEWEYACDASFCLIRGGAFDSSDVMSMRCQTKTGYPIGTKDKESVGFRCCSK